jgi:hypothetical protein
MEIAHVLLDYILCKLIIAITPSGLILLTFRQPVYLRSVSCPDEIKICLEGVFYIDKKQ